MNESCGSVKSEPDIPYSFSEKQNILIFWLSKRVSSLYLKICIVTQSIVSILTEHNLLSNLV